MAEMWNLGGLTVPELLKLIPLARLAGAGADMRTLLSGSFEQFLPQDAAALVTAAIRDLDASARAAAASLAAGTFGALWAGVNASWSMIDGLNTAYEVKEDRDWRKISVIAVSLWLMVLALIFGALWAMHFLSAGHNVFAPILQWAAVIVFLLISFGFFYRFGPNLKDRRRQWSTPGAVFGAMLWVGTTIAFREYCDRISHYHQIYGRVAPVAALMIWLYLTSATVLIGAELNSELEKARDHQAGADAQR
jgi:membrane protein